MYFLELDSSWVSEIPGGPAYFQNISLNLGLPVGACGAKWPTQQNEHLVFLNTSGDVLVKIVEKVRVHFMYTRSGHGPTLLYRYNR